MARRIPEPPPERAPALLVFSKSEELERRVQRLEQRIAALQAQLEHVIAIKRLH